MRGPSSSGKRTACYLGQGCARDAGRGQPVEVVIGEAPVLRRGERIGDRGDVADRIVGVSKPVVIDAALDMGELGEQAARGVVGALGRDSVGAQDAFPILQQPRTLRGSRGAHTSS